MPSARNSALVAIAALAIYYAATGREKNTNLDVNGYVHPMFEEVREKFREHLANGRQKGASFAIYHKGQPLVDLYGGYADEQANREWTNETLSQCWSVTKGLSAIVVAMMVERGYLDYNEYVHTYWPEFGKDEKKNVTLAMLLSHQAGVVALDELILVKDYDDKWNSIEMQMANQKPFWPPGKMRSYHAFTWGMYVDAVVRRADPKHRSVSEFFRDELAKPLGLDFHIGLPVEEYYRSTRVDHLPMWRFLFGTYILNPKNWDLIPSLFTSDLSTKATLAADAGINTELMNDPKVRSATLPSCNGFGNARGPAKIYDFLANGGTINGRKLVGPKVLETLKTIITYNIPFVLFRDHFSTGLVVEKDLDGNRVIGHRGYGGQHAYANLDLNLGVAYVTNYHSPFSDQNDPVLDELLSVTNRCMHKFRSLQTKQA